MSALPIPDPPEVDVDMPETYELDTELDDAQRARWFIDSDVLASWAMRKLAGLRSAQRRDDATASAEHERIDRWRAWRARGREAHIEFFTRHLEDYGRRQREAGRKSLSLPTGEVRTREVRGGFRVVDEAAVLEWARDYAPQAIRVRESLDKAALNAAIKATGEVPPGVEPEPDRVSVTVSTEPVDAEVVES